MQDGTEEPLELTAERRDQARPMRRSRIWFAVVALLAAAGAIWYAFDQTNKAGEEGVAPLIKADEGPSRVKPDEPGGMEVPHQDKEVYEKLGSDEPAAAPKAESLLPPPEQPLPRPAPTAVAREPTKPIPVINSVEESPPEPPAAKKPAAVAAKETPAPAPAAAEKAKPAAEEPKAAEAPEARETQMAAKPPAAAGSYRVQLSSLRSEADADAAWKKLQTKFPDLLGDLAVNVVKVELGEKGTYYRVQAGAMTEQAAKDLCAELKRRNADCLVVKS